MDFVYFFCIFQSIARDGKFVAGAGATEIELAVQLEKYAGTLPGLDQYAVRKFATALESFPKTLADNSGHRSTSVLEKLLEAHQSGKKNVGVDIENENSICDAVEKNILDLYACKMWGLKYAVGAAATILRVDQIIMAKRAGGPKPRAGPANSDDES